MVFDDIWPLADDLVNLYVVDLVKNRRKVRRNTNDYAGASV